MKQNRFVKTFIPR